jgi:hypothetical protein
VLIAISKKGQIRGVILTTLVRGEKKCKEFINILI